MFRVAIGVFAAVLLSIALYRDVRTSQLGARLVRAQPDTVEADPELKKYAQSMAPVLYSKHCATCHGASLQGDQSLGAPSLSDRTWLYGNGSIGDIETTIPYGIRSGHPKAHNIVDMPALGRTGFLTSRDVSDVVEFVLELNARSRDDFAAARGQKIFDGVGLCYDCHGSDALGVSDYGTPALTGVGHAWLNGGDRGTIYQSIFDGRHGMCPAWVGKLSFTQIRALALYLHEKSQHA